jgi:hypothetical protein
MRICVLCLIVAPMPPVETPFAVQINNNNKTDPSLIALQE